MSARGYRELVPFFVPDANEVNEGMKVYSSGSEDFERDSLDESSIRVWDKEEGFFVETRTPKSERKSRSSSRYPRRVSPSKFAGLTFETRVPEPSELPLPKLLRI
ncbi:hypothetical protein NDN08_005856 [Rhodosorus marinus]|uniref:Uncharacterized protein n=1 Tax=Rhodosorus marinus TaxID=101924 RepID=A0AAV8V560_9RHOD|nr:hypothetical protein NDN08_005856 [Rhodosorus marinus]